MDRDLVLFVIGRITERVNRFLAGELREGGMRELGVSHMEIIGVLTRREKIQMKDLVNLIGKDKSTITALVKKLVRMGLVKKSADPGDSRVSFISLTVKGKGLEPVINAISVRLRARAYRGLTEREKGDLMRLLGKMLGNF
ncbi:MAG: MarR family transcriptional regulator [Spirochaetes bacterium]|nr:MAG: MarR family transcriptional regulator [Spirochaetota bacterium]